MVACHAALPLGQQSLARITRRSALVESSLGLRCLGTLEAARDSSLIRTNLHKVAVQLGFLLVVDGAADVGSQDLQQVWLEH